MKILITGAQGFIGGHLYNKLKQEGHAVIGIDDYSHPSKNPIPRASSWLDPLSGIRRKDVRDDCVWGDIAGCDVVYHLAAQIHVDKSIKDPYDTIDRNINGTLNILEACRRYNKKLVFASSSEVYGTSQSEYMDESHPLDAQSPYGASKVAGDRLCKAYIDTYGLDICILRNFNTFGPYQNDGGDGKSYGAVIGIFARAALRNKPLTIFGDGRQERDYMYINDAIEGYKIASGYTGVLNIGTGKTISILELAERIKDITNSKSQIVFIDKREGEVMRLCAGIEKAKSLGFNPTTNFSEHLSEYINWLIKNNEKI